MNADLFEVTPTSTTLVRNLKSFSRFASLAVVLLGCVVLVGWVLDIDLLKSVLPGHVTMKANTALGIIGSGLSLWLWHLKLAIQREKIKRKIRFFSLTCAGFVIVLGLLTLVEYGFDLNLHIDQLLFQDSLDAVDALAQGRMAPNTAWSFVFSGTAFILLERHHCRWVQFLSLMMFLTALFALTGHLYGVALFYSVGSNTGMAIPTAVGFMLLGLGFLFACADQGWMQEFSSNNAGGVMARRLAPIIIASPLLLGFMAVVIYQKLDISGAQLITLRSMVEITIFTIVIWWNARSLNRMDIYRQTMQQQLIHSEAQLRQVNQHLEATVSERTAQLAETNASIKQEIQQRQVAQTQLRESEERFRRAIVDSPLPVLIHAEDGEVIQISKALTEITGYIPAELSTIADWTQKAYGERQELVQEKINQLYVLNQRVHEGEYTIRTKDGTQRIWDFSSAPLGSLPDGRRLVISKASDVTERKQAENALATRLEQQEIVVQLGQTALSGGDLTALFDHTVALVAHGLQVEYCKVLELLPSGNELLLRAGVGWQAGLVGHATVGTDRNSQAGYTLLAEAPVIVEDLRTETRFNGPPLLRDHQVVSGMSTIISGRGTQPFGILGVHTTQKRQFTHDDVNFLQAVANILAIAISRQQSEEEIRQLNLSLEQRVQERTQKLEEVNQELEAFSYSISHDLRAPLRAIEGFALALQEDYGDSLDDLGREYTQRLVDAASHLDKLILDLLEYSRLGRNDIRLQQVSLTAMVDGVLQELQPEIQEAQANITVKPSLPIVTAQRNVLRQMFANLLRNGIKFVAADVQPRVCIWAQERGEYVRLWVEDNGIGIAPQHQEKIFKPFERLHGIEAYPGTGIGLAIVRRGAERMGGQVGVESNPSQGSRFWIELLQYRDNRT